MKVVDQVYEVSIKKIRPQHDININIFPVESEKKINELTNSIRDCDLDRPIEIKKDYSIVCGHNRYEAAVRAGKKTIKCIFKSFKTREEELAYMIRDNFVRRQFTRSQKKKVVENFVASYKGKITGESISRMFGFSYGTAVSLLHEVAPERLRKKRKAYTAADLCIKSIDQQYRASLKKLSLFPLPVIDRVHKLTKEYLKEIEAIKKRASR